MRRIRKESAAWFKLAQAIDAQRVGYGFLCWYLDPSPYQDDKYTDFAVGLGIDCRHSMMTRLIGHMTGAEDGWENAGVYGSAWRSSIFVTTANELRELHAQRKARVLACLMFGHEAKSEGR